MKMTKWMNAYHIKVTFPVALTLLLGGCGNMGGLSAGNSQQITIESDPAGATVLADGVEAGVTPLTITPADTFRSGFTGGSDSLIAFRYFGKLMLRKPGCKDYLTQVDDNLLAKDIHVKLECDPNYRPPAAQPAVAPVPAPAAQQQIPASAEQRLQRIESLHEKGLISDEEQQRLRKRVLDTL
jgi:hypothetical protein